jgi:hypothetical protein
VKRDHFALDLGHFSCNAARNPAVRAKTGPASLRFRQDHLSA